MAKFFISLLLFISLSNHLSAQDTSAKVYKIALLTPLYLDSAFIGATYKLGSNSIPKYMMPGLDFYHGAMQAVQQLNKENASIELIVLDTKRADQSIGQMMGSLEVQKVSLIISFITNLKEQATVSSYAFNKNIPIISATYPNESGVAMNPFFIMLNTTLNTHIEALYQQIANNHLSKHNLLWVTKEGVVEEKIGSKINELKAKKNLPFKRINLQDSTDFSDFVYSLDSTKVQTILCASVNEAFGINLLKTLQKLPAYKCIVYGMPTWNSINNIEKYCGKNIEVNFTTSFNPKQNATYQSIQATYRAKYGGRPSDAYFKGYESIYQFSNLLLKYGADFLNNLSDKSFTVFNDFDIKPYKIVDNSFVPDFLENKKVYFIKKASKTSSPPINN